MDEQSVGYVELESRAIESVGYHPPSRAMRVQFRSSGRTYEYAGVPRHVFEGLIRAESRGRYFAHHVRDRYPARMVD